MKKKIILLKNLIKIINNLKILIKYYKNLSKFRLRRFNSLNFYIFFISKCIA